MCGDLVVRVGKAHNKHLVVLRDYRGSCCLGEVFLVALQAQLVSDVGGEPMRQYAWKVEELDHIEILR